VNYLYRNERQAYPFAHLKVCLDEILELIKIP
jgi:hypothetical protein